MTPPTDNRQGINPDDVSAATPLGQTLKLRRVSLVRLGVYLLVLLSASLGKKAQEGIYMRVRQNTSF